MCTKKTCKGCKAACCEDMTHTIREVPACNLGFKREWWGNASGNPLEPCPKPLTQKEYDQLFDAIIVRRKLK